MGANLAPSNRDQARSAKIVQQAVSTRCGIRQRATCVLFCVYLLISVVHVRHAQLDHLR